MDSTSVQTRNPLRALPVIEVLDRAFRVYRANFAVIVIIVTIVSIPLAIVRGGLARNYAADLSAIRVLGSNPTYSSLALQRSGSLFGFFIGTMLLAIVEGVVIGGAMSYLASEAMFARKVSLPEVLIKVWSRRGNLVLGLLAYYLFVFVSVFVVALSTAFCIGLVLAFILIGYIVLAMGAFSVPVLTLEPTAPIRGLNRAYALAKSRFWSLMGVGALIYILNLIIGTLVGLGTYYLLQQGAPLSTINNIQTVVEILQSIIISPVLPIAMTLLYYDTRIRQEGLDIMLKVADKPDVRPIDVAVIPPAIGFVNRDFRNMGIGVLGILVIIMVALIFVRNF